MTGERKPIYEELQAALAETRRALDAALVRDRATDVQLARVVEDPNPLDRTLRGPVWNMNRSLESRSHPGALRFSVYMVEGDRLCRRGG